MNTTPEQREKLIAARLLASVGEWTAGESESYDEWQQINDINGALIADGMSYVEAEYIAAAHNALPDLISDIAELEAKTLEIRLQLSSVLSDKTADPNTRLFRIHGILNSIDGT